MTTRQTRAHVAAFTLLAVVACSGRAPAQDRIDSATPAATLAGGRDTTSGPDDTLAGTALAGPSRSETRVLAGRPDVWRDLFTGTWSDARRLPSKGTLEWMTVGAVAFLGARPADSHVGRSLSTASQLREPFEPGALIGSTPLQLGMSAATYALGRATHSPRMSAVGADLFRAQLLSQGLTIGLKEAVRRRRPEGSGFAFPSGHTTVSFASATVLQQHFGWGVGAPAYALASYVALSRVQMKRHYLSDVAFGAALGIAAGRTITIGHERRMQLAPMAADGGAGVQFSWVGKK